MKEAKEPEIIKLFGKKIILPENGRVRSPVISTVQESVKKISIPNNGILFPAGVLRDQAVFNKENNYVSERDHRIEEKIASEEFEEDDGKEFEEADEAYEQKQVTEKDKYSTGEESENPNDNSNITLSNDDSTTGEPSKNQKTLKKPDKILPCPRCKSIDTKFCYYNNYNVLQPRHFCKSCQRYWTAGGTMRNVPVGAGRRKNKAATVPHFGHITISDTPPLSQIETSNNYHHQAFKPKRTFLSFGSDSPLHESSPTVLNLVERTPSLQNMNAFPSAIPCLPGVPWPYNTISMPFYPPPYWNRSVPGPWNVPWVSPNSSTLGKHSRNGELLKPNTREGDSALEKKESEGSVIVPKTLRIDDPDEAAKSSIWETLGIKFDNCVNNGGIFNGYKSKADEKKHISTLSPVLHANPAALSRALSYQETA